MSHLYFRSEVNWAISEKFYNQIVDLSSLIGVELITFHHLREIFRQTFLKLDRIKFFVTLSKVLFFPLNTQMTIRNIIHTYIASSSFQHSPRFLLKEAERETYV